jgi:hypothetical protein
MPQKFRKKPIEVEAQQLNALDGWDSVVELAEWCGGQAFCDWGQENKGYYWAIHLEGTMRATAGDWIIRGVQGEFYPCKPDIFAATYEPVAEIN